MGRSTGSEFFRLLKRQNYTGYLGLDLGKKRQRWWRTSSLAAEFIQRTAAMQGITVERNKQRDLPEDPRMRVRAQHVRPQEEIGDAVGDDAGPEAAGCDEQCAINQPADDGGHPLEMDAGAEDSGDDQISLPIPLTHLSQLEIIGLPAACARDNPAKKNSSITGTTNDAPAQRTAINDHLSQCD